MLTGGDVLHFTDLTA
jgi:hypothetical protein